MVVVDSLLHDLRGLGPGPQRLPHVAVSVVEAGQVHVGVDVLVVVVFLSRADGLRDGDGSRYTQDTTRTRIDLPYDDA